MKRLPKVLSAILSAAAAVSCLTVSAGAAPEIRSFRIQELQNMGDLSLQDILKKLAPNCDLDLPLPDCNLPGQPDTPEQPELPETELSEYAKEVVRLVNAERTAVGLDELSLDSGVQSAAQVRAREQETVFSHTRPDGSSCFTALVDAGVSYRGAGENIAYGQTSPQEVMRVWMNSSGHRANILNDRFTSVGVGFHIGEDGTCYWSQMFTY